MSTCESVGLSNQVSLSLKSYIIIINVFLNVQKNGIDERPAYLKIVVRIYLQIWVRTVNTLGSWMTCFFNDCKDLPAGLES